MKNTKIKLWTLSMVLLSATYWGHAQDRLVNALNMNVSEQSKELYQFTDVITVETTSIKNQGSSGTCWSYSGNSFIESEMMRMGKKPVEISQIFTARNAYVEKGKMYVRMHGA